MTGCDTAVHAVHMGAPTRLCCCDESVYRAAMLLEMSVLLTKCALTGANVVYVLYEYLQVARMLSSVRFVWISAAVCESRRH